MSNTSSVRMLAYGQELLANSLQAAFKAWTNIIARWPKDLVRPENVSFQTLMRRRLDHHTGQAISKAPGKESGSAAATASPILWQEATEVKQTQVLDSLLENRYASKYPMPASLRNPKSNPTYYDDLVREMHEAPNRSWFGGVVKRFKGSLRLT